MVLILGMTCLNVLQAETYTNYLHNYYKINIFPKRDEHLTDQKIYIFVLKSTVKNAYPVTYNFLSTQTKIELFKRVRRQQYLLDYTD